jgi:hypothetical protein
MIFRIYFLILGGGGRELGSVVFNLDMIVMSIYLNSSCFSTCPNFMQPQNESAQQRVRPFRVSVEGNIGAGKSELIRYFSSFPDVDAHMVSSLIKCQKHVLIFLSSGGVV